uniref:Membrane insertase YidC/Oxa/ALB C-terminal domain-containing protein n=1 Tax=Helicotheca tamesis TaxID=374047 RepID=A0A7S2GSG5_9STRA|mmetsp:Transcript_11475/g.15926  ORF Transcript_11475/g.15926 Transcript_11475/m.15926 type:complete len:490 (+) Transcript_11475:172-1641(+)|eukprot:CAMPEP_0185735614 /NCGR_PEP_ID=MMETSP1171-20130828/25772_1 /TAXON_ID=374046 /ORGANISM="Helicotheca tamensis, Strain CCMP826" /LENGTH=489 /DNA_ID=CAMNT_0028405993 /DNA_START=105 /DNA_END=1574 /DNA_ORIENTATION=-
MRIFLFLALACGAIQNKQNSGVLAFAPSSFSTKATRTAPNAFVTSRQKSNAKAVSSSLHMVAPQPHDLIDIHTTATSISHAADIFHSHLSSASTLLADAADAAAEVADADKTGWWQSYLNVFKGCLIFVHSKIDEPLRGVGWEQTWGISIALFTAGVRSLLLPLSVQQTKSSEYMKALKPYQDQIKKKFADKKEMQNRAIAKLYEDAEQNPLAGCLVSLAQLPIFLGLYRSVTLLAKDGQLQEPFLWIPSLEGPVTAPTYRGMEWLTQGWTTDPGATLPHPSLGWETTLAFLAMPMILVLTQSFTMNAMQPPIDENVSDEEREQLEKTQNILKFLPLLIGYFSLQVPAGLTIYWFTSNMFTLLQSLSVKAYFKANPPKIELPDYWDALDNAEEMTPEERRKAAEAGLNTGPSFEQLMDEAKFHYVVQRTPLREGSSAWERVQANGATVPKELEAWVNSDKSNISNASSLPTPTPEEVPTPTSEEETAKV